MCLSHRRDQTSTITSAARKRSRPCLYDRMTPGYRHRQLSLLGMMLLANPPPATAFAYQFCSRCCKHRDDDAACNWRVAGDAWSLRNPAVASSRCRLHSFEHKCYCHQAVARSQQTKEPTGRIVHASLHAGSQLTTATGSSNCRRPAGSQTIQNSRHFARHTVLVLQP